MHLALLQKTGRKHARNYTTVKYGLFKNDTIKYKQYTVITQVLLHLTAHNTFNVLVYIQKFTQLKMHIFIKHNTTVYSSSS